MKFMPLAAEQIEVAVAGTKVQVSSNQNLNVRSLTLQADPDNSGVVFVGGVEVDDTHCIKLAAGQSITLEVEGDFMNVSSVYLDADTNSQKVNVLYPVRL